MSRWHRWCTCQQRRTYGLPQSANHISPSLRVRRRTAWPARALNLHLNVLHNGVVELGSVALAAAVPALDLKVASQLLCLLLCVGKLSCHFVVVRLEPTQLLALCLERLQQVES